jgi:hypothetical protein
MKYVKDVAIIVKKLAWGNAIYQDKIQAQPVKINVVAVVISARRNA